MALDTSSFAAYVRSLQLHTNVNTQPGRIIPGPPAPLLDAALRLGLAPLLLNNQRTRTLLTNLGLDPAPVIAATRRLRSRAMYPAVMQGLAEPEIRAADKLAGEGETERAIKHTRAALLILFISMVGDGYYFFTPMSQRRQVLATTRRLHRQLRLMQGERVERIAIRTPHGLVNGLLHLPPEAGPSEGGQGGQRYPGVLAFHPLGSDKDQYDDSLGHFRAAGYATFCVDLPAHGESYDGPRLRPDAEAVGVMALEVLAQQPGIDSHRIGVMGGSLGGHFALRTAAASKRVRACLTYSAPFDLAHRMECTLPGVVDSFGWVVGASDQHSLMAAVRRFHLRDVLGGIECPVGVLHGTQDHICDFTASYEIASRLKAPVTVQPLIGADHEAANPGTEEFAIPGVEWLRQTL